MDKIMDKIMDDRFSFTLVLMCIFAAFIANIIHSAQKVLPREECPLALAAIIGPVEQYNCPFPILNSVLRISISCYLFLFLIVLIISFKSYSAYSCPARFSLEKCMPWTIAVLSVSHYLCFISIVMDCYVVYTAFKFTRHDIKYQLCSVRGAVNRFGEILNFESNLNQFERFEAVRNCARF